MKRFWQCALLAALTLAALAGSASAEAIIVWDKSSIAVTGQCLPDGRAEFSVVNTGADMAGPAEWRAYETDVLTNSGTFQLAASATQTRTFGPLPGVAIRAAATRAWSSPVAGRPC